MKLPSLGELPFLDVLIYKRGDGCVGHRVYRKPTHTDIYLNANSCHHPAEKRSVLNTLIHHAVSVSDTDSSQAELRYLRSLFSIHQAIT